MKLTKKDYELIEEVKRTFDTLFLPGVHEVAAALRTVSGEVFCGIHIEADVGFADVCGEVAAICHMVAHGQRKLDTIVAVHGDGKQHYRILSPCGRCREVIKDFNRNAWVIVGNFENPQKVSIAELLPLR
jgi:cytidine deaminase